MITSSSLPEPKHHARILVVDDEWEILHLLHRGLEQAGFAIDSFVDPKEALAHYKSDYYAGIILDIRMPRMSGFELARRIWGMDPSARICFLTAFEISEQEAKWMFPNLQSWCFLTKPLSIAQLLGHLQKHGITSLG